MRSLWDKLFLSRTGFAFEISVVLRECLRTGERAGGDVPDDSKDRFQDSIIESGLSLYLDELQDRVGGPDFDQLTERDLIRSFVLNLRFFELYYRKSQEDEQESESFKATNCAESQSCIVSPLSASYLAEAIIVMGAYEPRLMSVHAWIRLQYVKIVRHLLEIMSGLLETYHGRPERYELLRSVLVQKPLRRRIERARQLATGRGILSSIELIDCFVFSLDVLEELRRIDGSYR